MNIRDYLYWLTMFGMMIGIIGSIALNQEVIIIGFIFSFGGLILDSFFRRKEQILRNPPRRSSSSISISFLLVKETCHCKTPPFFLMYFIYFRFIKAKLHQSGRQNRNIVLIVQKPQYYVRDEIYGIINCWRNNLNFFSNVHHHINCSILVCLFNLKTKT